MRVLFCFVTFPHDILTTSPPYVKLPKYYSREPCESTKPYQVRTRYNIFSVYPISLWFF